MKNVNAVHTSAHCKVNNKPLLHKQQHCLCLITIDLLTNDRHIKNENENSQKMKKTRKCANTPTDQKHTLSLNQISNQKKRKKEYIKSRTCHLFEISEKDNFRFRIVLYSMTMNGNTAVESEFYSNFFFLIFLSCPFFSVSLSLFVFAAD